MTTVRAWAGAAWPTVSVRIETDVLAAWAGARRGARRGPDLRDRQHLLRPEGGRRRGAGGRLGPLFGDEGSAYWIGVAALRGLARAVDGAEPASPLAAALVARWPELGGDLRSWLRGVYRLGWGREQVASLAAEVAALAEQGDAEAAGLVRAAAAELAELARVVAQGLGSASLPLALLGGMAACSLLRDEIAARLRGLGASLVPAPPRFTAVEGAALLAAEGWGGPAAVSRLRTLPQ